MTSKIVGTHVGFSLGNDGGHLAPADLPHQVFADQLTSYDQCRPAVEVVTKNESHRQNTSDT